MKEVDRLFVTSHESAESFYSHYSPHFFAPSTALERRGELLKISEEDLRAQTVNNTPRAEAKKMYAELNGWNREMHEHMVEVLEPAFLQLTDRMVSTIAAQPNTFRQRARQLEFFDAPYKFAGLPPNLFDHLDTSRPFLPNGVDETIKLVNDYRIYNERLKKYRLSEEIHIGKEQEYRDIALELLRRQRDMPELFESNDQRQAWINYNAAFKASVLKNGVRARDTFHQNVRFVNYLSNRQFSEAGGFFEETDSIFDNFLLADYIPSRSAFTSQIRVPYNSGHKTDAEALLKATYLLMELVSTDPWIKEDIENCKPEDVNSLSRHLTRMQEVDIVKSGFVPASIRTLLEGIASISAIFSICEADGIPTFENDLWGGLNRMLIDDVPVKVTATMAQGFVVPSTLHGNYLKDFLEMTKGGLLVRSSNAKKIQRVHDRRTAAIHERWARYYEAIEQQKEAQNSSTPIPDPPVRFGLHCPFKSEVVRRLSEALLVCRAAVCE